MTIAEIAMRMIAYPGATRRDINHLLKVHAFARLIAERENVGADALRTIEAAALMHDIAIPLCREKYGSTAGKLQEREGMELARTFFRGTDAEDALIDRVTYLVGRHHTLTDIDGIDYQILIEADYLVNADESDYETESVRNMLERVFRTKTGKEILKRMYLE